MDEQFFYKNSVLYQLTPDQPFSISLYIQMQKPRKIIVLASKLKIIIFKYSFIFCLRLLVYIKLYKIWTDFFILKIAIATPVFLFLIFIFIIFCTTRVYNGNQCYLIFSLRMILISPDQTRYFHIYCNFETCTSYCHQDI